MIVNLTHPGLVYVMSHLRRADAIEVKATIGAERACELIETIPGAKWEARTDAGVPAVIGGCVPVWQGLMSGWMWGTDDWPLVAREVTKFTKRFILPALDSHGMHRMECRPMAGNAAVERWLKLVGFRPEAVTAQFGQGREDFVLFARTKGHDGDWLH